MLTGKTFLGHWPQELLERPIFLAVSGGVDSMVLLDLLQKAFPTQSLTLLHVNYGLRKEADSETEYLKKWAEKNQRELKIKYFPKNEKFTEEIGRTFRYSFFKNELTEEAILVTAHHLDDLTETLLMKITRGTNLDHLAVDAQQIFGAGLLFRPLLSFSKDEIQQYADYHQLTFFIDKSNFDLRFTRNRYRHQIIPLLQKENPRLNTQMFKLNQSLIPLKQKPAPQKKESPETTAPQVIPQVKYPLAKNTWLQLSPTEKIGLFDPNLPPAWPNSGAATIVPFYQEIPDNLIVRHPEAGDLLALKKENYTKKLRRYLIDAKVPLEKRPEVWVVADNLKNILWSQPNGKSYLSSYLETDKILYILIYVKENKGDEHVN
ncbi:tRNA lysidine(34) synthetase TilS [Enterococcus timonensis]|uniref:tRNA lysidine(34) synthetase TilS n=1 Tax=Enterococcus timonensis TaxID=1852364 RepID=UPI0008DAD898|nr:tRNA lysidine(34) synthetase TilS [Enterococcus timonensis]